MTDITPAGAAPPAPSPKNDWRGAFRALRRLLADSERTEEVFNLIDALSANADNRAFDRFRADPVGRTLLDERPDLLGTLSDREGLRALPEGSFGRAYAAFMDEAALSAGGLVEASERNAAPGPEPDLPDADERQWTGERLRDSHDLWHVLTGYGRDEAGEVALLAFTWAQTRNLGIGVIVVVGAAIGLLSGFFGWPAYLRRAYRRGVAAERLQFAPYEQWLARPLEDVRRDLAIEPPERAHPDGFVVANRGETPKLAGTAAA